MTDPESEIYQDEQADEIEREGMAAELAIMSVIATRLARVKDGTTYADARRWQVEDMAKIRRILERARDVFARRAEIMADVAAKTSDEWAAPFYEARGKEQTPAREDMFLNAALKHGEKKTVQKVADLTKSTVMGLVQHEHLGGGVASIGGFYQNLIDQMIKAVPRADRDEILLSVVKTMSKSGCRVMYASGHTRELYAAVSQNMLDGFRTTMQDVRDKQAEQFGADGVEISAHGLCAKDHLPYQGKQYTTEEFEAIQKELKRPFGKWNCRHRVSPVVLGVSAKTYTAKQREEYRKLSEGMTDFMDESGKRLTRYEFSQWQRAEETKIRKAKMQAALIERSGLDATAEREAIEAAVKRYRAASRKAQVSTHMNRLEVYDWTI